VFAAYEDVIRSIIKEKLTRGHADVFVSFKDKREKESCLTVDTALASSYLAAAKILKEAHPDLQDDLTLTALLRYPEVLKQEDSVTLDESMIQALKVALNGALDNLNQMREVEGKKLEEDMLSRMDTIADFINEVAVELRKNGRRAIIWGDMFLYQHGHYNPKNQYTCNAPSAEAEEYMLSRLSRDIVIADWQYDVTESPVETADVFTNAGFDCLLCPWDRGNNQIRAVFKTIHSLHLFGVLHTTWHTLYHGMPYVVVAAKGGYENVYENVDACSRERVRTHTAALLRKVLPSGGDYEKSGWKKYQIEN
jgi:hypothetical protein